MNIVDNYIAVLKKYAEFDGRTTRSEFWYFVLASVIVGLLIGFISDSLGILYYLVVLVPSVAVGARRLHDIGNSGWMQLVSLIPLVGPIWLIILLATKSTGDNQYGKVVEVSMPSKISETQIVSEEK